MSDVDFRRVPADEAGSLRDELGEVYREVFAEPPYEYGEEHVQLFLERFDVQRQRPGAALVVVRDAAGTMAGFSFGLTMPSTSPWWTGFTTEVDPGVTDEPAGRPSC